MLADKLPVGKQAVDAVRSEQADVALQQRYPLLGVGVPFLWQHAEHQRVGHAVMHYGKHEDVDVRLPKLPVGPVNGQLQRAFYWKQPENESCDKVRIERLFGIETLYSPQT